MSSGMRLLNRQSNLEWTTYKGCKELCVYSNWDIYVRLSVWVFHVIRIPFVEFSRNRCREIRYLLSIRKLIKQLYYKTNRALLIIVCNNRLQVKQIIPVIFVKKNWMQMYCICEIWLVRQLLLLKFSVNNVPRINHQNIVITQI